MAVQGLGARSVMVVTDLWVLGRYAMFVGVFTKEKWVQGGDSGGEEIGSGNRA